MLRQTCYRKEGVVSAEQSRDYDLHFTKFDCLGTPICFLNNPRYMSGVYSLQGLSDARKARASEVRDSQASFPGFGRVCPAIRGYYDGQESRIRPVPVQATYVYSPFAMGRRMRKDYTW